MTAQKGNRSYTIDETQKKHYIEQGFDILGDDGNVIDYGRGKTVAYKDYAALEKELEELKESSGGDNSEVIDILKDYAEMLGVDVGKSNSISGLVKKIKEFEPKEGE